MNWLSVRRPIQYLGSELNLRAHDAEGKRLRVCVCFPEHYDVGMSCLGYRIVHDIFAAHPDVACERAFLPMDDMLDVLAAEKRTPFSLETHTALAAFDVLAMSINCEINQVSAVRLLSLAGIPLKASERSDAHPFVLIGGLNNPEPIADMCDAIILGEFEDIAADVIAALTETAGMPKKERCDALAKIPGLYIPGRYRLGQSGIEPVSSDTPPQVCRVFAESFVKDYAPKRWILPYSQIVFDRVQIEVQRGCPNQCTFCQARCVYYPYRERSPELIMRAVDDMYRQTGYDEISLLGLSVVDYRAIDALLDELIPYAKKRRLNVMIPSIRPTPKAFDILDRLSFGGRKPSMTLAMEAADDDLRRSFGKVIKNDDVEAMVKDGAQRGYRTFKFYYLTGFPGEDEGHIDRIADFVERCSGAVCNAKGFRPHMNVSVNCLMPKPFSVLQETPLLDETRYLQRVERLKSRFFKRRNIMVSYLDYSQVLVESLLSRADRSLFPVICDMAVAAGGASEKLYDRSRWFEACKRYGVDPDRITGSSQTLPRHIVVARDAHMKRLQEKAE